MLSTLSRKTLDETVRVANEPVRNVAALISAIEWDSAIVSDGNSGADVIAELVKRLPNKPGVYRMFNEAGDVLYVGKAHSLKKRVSNYARGQGHNNRIARMIRETMKMEFVVTRTETEALLLEANLIKRLRPRFNVLMRDDKSFPVYFADSAKTGESGALAPGIFKHRGARSSKGDYFGPIRFCRCGRAEQSPRCSVPFCCAPARIRFMRTARAPACSTRSSAAPAPAPAKLTSATMMSWLPRRRRFFRARARR